MIRAGAGNQLTVLLLGCLLSGLLLVGTRLGAGSAVGRVAGGALLLPGCFLLPGAALLGWFVPRRKLEATAWVGWSLALSLGWLAPAATLVKLLGLNLNREIITALILLPAAASLLGRRSAPTVSGLGIARPWALGFGLLVIGAFLTWRPFLPSEGALWPDEYSRLLDSAAALRAESDCSEVSFEAAGGFLRDRDGALLPTGGRGLIFLKSRSVRKCHCPLLLFFTAGEEILVEANLNGKLSVFRYLSAPYNPARVGRNYPPPKAAALLQAELLPGENLLELTFRGPDGGLFSRPPRIKVFDGFPPGGGREFFLRRWLSADTGDIREQLDLARSLLCSPLPRAASHDGTFFDGGGFTIEHFPFPFLAQALFLGLWENSLRAFHLLAWGILGLLLLGFLHLAGFRSGAGAAWAALASSAELYLLLHLVRYRVDTPYVGLFLAVPAFFLLVHLRREELAPCLLWGLGMLLTKGGAVFLLLEIFAFQAVYRRGRFTARLGVLLLALGIPLLAAAVLPARLEASTEAWREMARGNYLDRFQGLRAVFSGDRFRAGLQLQAAARYGWLFLLGSGFSAALWPLGRGRMSRLAMILAVAFFLPVAFSRPSLISAGYAGHRASYLLPGILFVPLPGLIFWRRTRGAARLAAAGAMLLGALLALPPAGRASATQERALDRGLVRVMSRAAQLDFLLRRGAEADRRTVLRLLPGFYAAAGQAAWPVYLRMGMLLDNSGFPEHAAQSLRLADELRGGSP